MNRWGQHVRIGILVGSAWGLWEVLMIAERASGLTHRPVDWTDEPAAIVFAFATGFVGGTAYSWLRTRAPTLQWPIAAAASGICGLLPLVVGGLLNPRSIVRTDAFPLVVLVLLPLGAIVGVCVVALARFGLFARWGAGAYRWAMRPNDP